MSEIIYFFIKIEKKNVLRSYILFELFLILDHTVIQDNHQSEM